MSPDGRRDILLYKFLSIVGYIYIELCFFCIYTCYMIIIHLYVYISLDSYEIPEGLK